MTEEEFIVAGWREKIWVLEEEEGYERRQAFLLIARMQSRGWGVCVSEGIGVGMVRREDVVLRDEGLREMWERFGEMWGLVRVCEEYGRVLGLEGIWELLEGMEGRVEELLGMGESGYE